MLNATNVNESADPIVLLNKTFKQHFLSSVAWFLFSYCVLTVQGPELHLSVLLALHYLDLILRVMHRMVIYLIKITEVAFTGKWVCRCVKTDL